MAHAKLGVGIVGAGRIAPTHAAGFQEVPDQAQVVAVCDVDREQAETLAALFAARVYTDARELIADSDVSLVDVLLPHHLHYEMAMAVIAAHKHLLLEKPPALTCAESLAIVEAAQRAGIRLEVAENTRYVQAYIEAERWIREGRIGEVSLVRTFLPANERVRLCSDGFWGKLARCGGGALIDSGPHTFYLLKWLFGGVQALAASTARLHGADSEVEDNAEVHGRLANGALFQSSFTFTAEIPHSERLEVYGSHGSLIADQLSNPPVRFYADPTDFEGMPVEGPPYDPMGWHYFSIVEEVKDFVRSVVEGRPPTVDPLDCCHAVRVIERAYESARNGGQWVQV